MSAERTRPIGENRGKSSRRFFSPLRAVTCARAILLEIIARCHRVVSIPLTRSISCVKLAINLTSASRCIDLNRPPETDSRCFSATTASVRHNQRMSRNLAHEVSESSDTVGACSPADLTTDRYYFEAVRAECKSRRRLRGAGGRLTREMRRTARELRNPRARDDRFLAKINRHACMRSRSRAHARAV